MKNDENEIAFEFINGVDYITDRRLYVQKDALLRRLIKEGQMEQVDPEQVRLKVQWRENNEFLIVETDLDPEGQPRAIEKSKLLSFINRQWFIEEEIPECADFCIDEEEYSQCLLISIKKNHTDFLRNQFGLPLYGCTVEARFIHWPTHEDDEPMQLEAAE